MSTTYGYVLTRENKDVGVTAYPTGPCVKLEWHEDGHMRTLTFDGELAARQLLGALQLAIDHLWDEP